MVRRDLPGTLCRLPLQKAASFRKAGLAVQRILHGVPVLRL